MAYLSRIARTAILKCCITRHPCHSHSVPMAGFTVGRQLFRLWPSLTVPCSSTLVLKPHASVLSSFVIVNIACAEQYVPQRCGNTKIGFGMIMMDVMNGRPISGKNLVKTVVVNGKMADPINGIA